MKKYACLGDKAVLIYFGQVLEGTITSISEKGIVVKNGRGSEFYKWCHVHKVENKLVEKLKHYQEVLRFYADDDNYDMKRIYDSYGEFVGSEADYDRGRKAQEVLKGIDKNEK